MGIVNVTPDSFSDGGHFFLVEAAVVRALEMEVAGATIIDVGGESSRPGAASVTAEEEMLRVIPVVREIRKRSEVVISIDTYKAAVAEAALEAGADIVNDISSLSDPDMGRVVAQAGAGLILMHKRGEPATMQETPEYDSVIIEVEEFLRQRRAVALEWGMASSSVVLDCGIGFGKTIEHNLALLAGLARLAALGSPLVLGVSRKSLLRNLLGAEATPQTIEAAGLSVAAWAWEQGARIFRVHEPSAYPRFFAELIEKGGLR